MLSFEEIATLVDVFTDAGVDRVRITGGEPLLRRDLPLLVERLAARPAIQDLAMTTNGVLLARHAAALKRSGLQRITVSLDTLQPGALRGLDAVRRARGGARRRSRPRPREFGALKLDTVVMRGINDDELVPLLEYSRRHGAELRFIEYMDVGGATRWSPEAVVSRREILAHLETHYGPIRPIGEPSSAPAERFSLPDGLTFGIIASTTEPFCASCDRAG